MVFFILSKLFSFLLKPFTWVCILVLIGALVRRRQVRKKFFLPALCLWLFFSNSFILDEFMRWWEPSLTNIASLEKHDIGIVLGGLSNYDVSNERLNFYSSTDRLNDAILLYKKGLIEKIFLSGGSGSIVEKDLRESIFLKKYLVDIGIPAHDVLMESISKNTYENAIYSREELKNYPYLKSILLITSASHMPRSIKCFEKAGLQVTPFPVDKNAGPRKFVFDHMVIPNVETMAGWNALLHEWFGYITYWFSGYI